MTRSVLEGPSGARRYSPSHRTRRRITARRVGVTACRNRAKAAPSPSFARASRTSQTSSCGTRPSDPPPERAVEVPHRGPVQDPDRVMGDPAPRLVVQITNSQPDAERLRLAFDGLLR